MSKRNFDYDRQIWLSRALLKHVDNVAKQQKVSTKSYIERVLRAATAFRPL